jgi:hypothetical protein
MQDSPLRTMAWKWWTSRLTIAATAAGSRKDLGPRAKHLVRAHDQRPALKAAADPGEEERRRVRIEWDVADLVDDEKRDPAESFELLIEPARTLGRPEAIDPALRGGTSDPMTTPCILDAESDREVSPAGGGRPRKTTFLASARKSRVAR